MNEMDETKSKPVLDADETGRDELLDQALAAVRGEEPPVGSELASGGIARATGFGLASCPKLRI